MSNNFCNNNNIKDKKTKFLTLKKKIICKIIKKIAY